MTSRSSPRLISRLAVPLRCLLLLGLGAALPGRASPPPDAPLRFRTMGWGVTAGDLFYSYKGEDVSLKLFDAGRSDFYRLQKSDTISFYRIIQKEGGVKQRVPVAEASLAGAGPTPLLIVTASRTDPAKLEMTAIADDLTAFPARTCRFVNFTPIAINATVGEASVTIPPGGIRLIDASSDGEASARYTTIFAQTVRGRLMLSYNNWVFRPGQRTLCFISLGKTGRPTVVRLVDAVPVAVARPVRR